MAARLERGDDWSDRGDCAVNPENVGVLGLRVGDLQDVGRVRVGRLNHGSVPGYVPVVGVDVGEVGSGFDVGLGLRHGDGGP